MQSVTFNVSFSKKLMQLMDRVAKREARSRSELLREAVRAYIERKERWQNIFAYWQRAAKKARVTPQDVDRIIAETRTRRRAA